MAQEAAPTDAPTGQEPQGDPKGQEPTKPETTGEEPKVFDEKYVQGLRAEAAKWRTEAQQAKERVQEFEDENKTEKQKLEERNAELQQAAAQNEMKALRYEVAATKGLDLQAAAFLTGTSREEVEAKADELTTLLASRQSAAVPGFDPGARTTPPEKKAPEEAHRDLLLEALGVKQQ